MGCEEKKPNKNFSNFTLVKKSKGNLFSEKPVFCDNGNSLVIPSGPSLYLYNTATGNYLKELFRSSDNIIACQLHPLDDSLLIAITENGELSVFNLKTGEVEYSIQLKLNQHFLNKQNAPRFSSKKAPKDSQFDWKTQPLDSVSHRKFFYAEVKTFQNNPSEIFVWTSWSLNDESHCHLSVFTFNSGKHIRLIHMQKSGLSKSYLSFVLGTVEGYEVFVGMCRTFVYVLRYDSQKRPFSMIHNIGGRRTLTCLAFHPTECCFATGDSSGKITIWKNIFEASPLRDEMHWHTLPVGDIFFSKLGNFLFSGGEENVLVKWSLSSRSKDFLPRLSSSIHNIAGHCESSLLSVSTTDNRVLIVDFSCKKVSTVQHFSKWAVLKNDRNRRIFTTDPRSNSLVLSGKTGHIQFLSLEEDGKFLYTFDVSDRNFITSDSDCVVVNTEVTHAAFSKDGSWLVTAESRFDRSCKESRLKFWTYSSEQNSFELNTNVEFPHADAPVHALQISSDDVVATAAPDRKFRLWTIFHFLDKATTQRHWALHAANEYRGFPCRAIDFSKDASVIAATFGPVLTVWDTDAPALKCSLSVPHKKDDLTACKFGNMDLSHLVVTTTDSAIFSWNIITLSMVWTVPLRTTLLVSDPFSLSMAVFSADNHLVVFSPASPTPDLLMHRVADRPVVAAHCVLTKTARFSLYFLTADQELFNLTDGDSLPTERASWPLQSVSTPFTAQLADVRSMKDADSGGRVPLSARSALSGPSPLDAPAHTLPNPSALCLEVLSGMYAACAKHPGGPRGAKEVRRHPVAKTSKALAGTDDACDDRLWLDFVKKVFA